MRYKPMNKTHVTIQIQQQKDLKTTQTQSGCERDGENETENYNPSTYLHMY